MNKNVRIKVALIGIWLSCLACCASSTRWFEAVAAETREDSSPFVEASSRHARIGKRDCKECHGAVLKKQNVHPVAEGCDTCHDYSEKGDAAEVKLTTEGSALCFTCHSEIQQRLQSGKFKHAPAEADCTICHDPHASDQPSLLKSKPVALCFTCHSDKASEAQSRKFTHAPIADVGCQACHNPHASDFAPMLRADANTTCLACHKLDFKHQRDEQGKLALFGGAAISPEYPDKAKKILVSADGKGHPYMGHPAFTPGASKTESAIACTSCHSPHFGNTQQLFVKDHTSQQLCAGCHK